MARKPRTAQRLIMVTGVLTGASVTAFVLGATPATAAISPSPAPSGSTDNTPFLGVDGVTALWFIGLVAAGVALLWFSILFFDVRSTSRWRERHQQQLLDKMIDRSRDKDGSLSIEEVRQLVSAMDQPPRGATGLTRSLLALTITTLVGVALVAALAADGQDAIEERKTIITSLLSIMATIFGFYFGARTAQTSSEQATTPPPVEPADGTTGPAGATGPEGAPGAAGATGAAGAAGATGAASDQPTGQPDVGTEDSSTDDADDEQAILPNPMGDEEEQVQDDDSPVLPDAPERDHR